MKGEYGLNRKPSEESLLDHFAGPAFILLGGLKDEKDSPLKFPAIGQTGGGSQEDGHVTVMTAGMHDPIVAGMVGKIILLLDGKGVEFGS